MDCSCAPILRFFSMVSDGATLDRQIPNRSFRQFRSIFRKDSFGVYGSIWTQFPAYVKGLDVLYNALKVS